MAFVFICDKLTGQAFVVPSAKSNKFVDFYKLLDLLKVLTTLNKFETLGDHEVATRMCNTFILIYSNSENLRNDFRHVRDYFSW